MYKKLAGGGGGQLGELSSAVEGEPAEEDMPEAVEMVVEEMAEEGFGRSLESTLWDLPRRASSYWLTLMMMKR